MQAQNLTWNERLLAKRRRAVDPRQSQRDAARKYDVSLRRYRCWETGEEEIPEEVEVAVHLFQHEECFVLRRRAGLSLQQLADKLRICRWWLCQMEYGRVSSSRLVDYWETKDRPWRRPNRVKKVASTG